MSELSCRRIRYLGANLVLLAFIVTGGDIVPALLVSGVKSCAPATWNLADDHETPPSTTRQFPFLFEKTALADAPDPDVCINSPVPCVCKISAFPDDPQTSCGASNFVDQQGPYDEGGCKTRDVNTFGDPINLFSGELYLQFTDLVIPGRGFDFALKRTYLSKTGRRTIMGYLWDMSYNIYLEQSDDSLMFYNGEGRYDLFTDQGDDTWGRDEYFRIIQQEPDDSYKMTHADRTVWRFAALDGAPAEGMITSIEDRNGNTMTFDYNAQGQLVTIHDTLDNPSNSREIAFTYSADGFLETVTDFTGRVIQYAYYTDHPNDPKNPDPGGSFGGLKSVTTPPVTNTPNGNDFPDGKTTTYTYSEGRGVGELNYNLLTITDGRRNDPNDPTFGTGPYVQNIYARTTNSSDFDYDRVVAQIYGDGRYDFTYIDLPNEPTTKVIVNNRRGQVKEIFYDDRNRLVARRDYTGFAPDATAPTTETDNRPTGKLRPSDPDFFETTYEYNANSQRTRIIHPNGNEEIFVYDEGNMSRRSQGNLLEHCWLPGPLGGDQTKISESFEYNTDFGGCCGFNFVTRHVDGRGNETLHMYDDSGNRTRTTHRIPSIVEDFEYNAFGQMTAHVLPDNGSSHRRRDVYIYYDSGPQMGYLQNKIVDATGLSLKTTYAHDMVGNVISITDPRNSETQYIVNQLNQTVREISREVSDGSGVRYERDIFYDANNNVIRIDIQNVDENGIMQSNGYFTTMFEYDILNYVIRKTEEVDPGHNIVTDYQYDKNNLLTLTRFGEATNHNQPTNVIRTEYDERDLRFRETRAVGDPAQSTTQYDYDGNKTLIRIHQGIEDTPHVTEYTYDGYNRMVSSTDPMGNAMTFHYDENHNQVSERTDGESPDMPGDTGNMRLSETTRVYDEMDRLIRTDVEFFDALSQFPIDDGQSIMQVFYSDNSQVVRTVDDTGDETLTTYDTANRVCTVTDPKGNTVDYAYDANSNQTSITEVEKSDLGNPDETFVTTNTYDNLDRLIQTMDNVGNTHCYGYDSRNNRTMTTDALDNETRYAYDGINRLVATIRDLDNDGADGDGPDITTAQSWDDTSRLTGQTDDNGNTTTYIYDPLNRMIAEDYADCTQHAYTYDVHDNRLTMADANGSVATCTYDLLDRLTNKSIDRASIADGDTVDVLGTTFEIYQYDGLSRLVRAEDDDSIVTRGYDSLSNVTQETLTIGVGPNQTTGTITSIYDGDSNKIDCTYPGGRTIFCIYDELDRKKLILDTTGAPTDIAEYFYIGPDRVERREYSNGTRTDYLYDGIANPPNDFGVKQIVRTTHAFNAGEPGETVIDDRTYTWDPMYNKTRRKDERAGGPQLTHNYTYDDVYRLIHTTVTDPGGMVLRDTDYALDGVGNRLATSGDPDSGAYALDPTICEPADFQMNQYTVTPFDEREYDPNGNLSRIILSLPDEMGACLKGDVNLDRTLNRLDIPEFATALLNGGPATCQTDLNEDGAVDGRDIQLFVTRLVETAISSGPFAVNYDYRNQMVQHVGLDIGVTSIYAYDALGRRIERVVNATGTPQTTRYFYDGWQVSEEQDATIPTANTRATYVYGLYIDEVVNMQRDTDANGTPEDYYYHADDLDNVIAITNSACSVMERYEYGDYGHPVNPITLTIIAGSPSAIGNHYFFTGRRYEAETGWYYYRTRYLDPSAGRFTTRDHKGYVDGMNLYHYVDSSPASFVDPYGESKGRKGQKKKMRKHRNKKRRRKAKKTPEPGSHKPVPGKSPTPSSPPGKRLPPGGKRRIDKKLFKKSLRTILIADCIKDCTEEYKSCLAKANENYAQQLKQNKRMAYFQNCWVLRNKNLSKDEKRRRTDENDKRRDEADQLAAKILALDMAACATEDLGCALGCMIPGWPF
ncbi:MAG: DUF6531 domain-containing protein [Phycisphaerales bacterium]|nr:DUF6531 domain-containing protein [Phycisphaerales bacterium]